MKSLSGKQLSPLLLRAGLSIIFLYAAVSSLTNPLDWVGYLPQSMRRAPSARTYLHAFSVYEIMLVLWLVSGKYLRYAGLVCAVTLAGIVASNFSLFAITFRDIALIFAALALALSADE